MDAWIGNPELHGDELIWKPAEDSADVDMLRPAPTRSWRTAG